MGDGAGEQGVGAVSTSKLEPTRTIWVTKNGQRVPAKEMTDRHLVNTLRMCLRNAQRDLKILQAKYEYGPPTFQGEMAQYYAERDWLDLIAMVPDDAEDWLESDLPTWATMVKEAEKRGLEWREEGG